MTTRHAFETDDSGLAAKIHALITQHETGAKAAPIAASTVAAQPPPQVNAAPPTTIAPTTNGATPPAPSAAVAPPPPTTAAPPPPAAVAPPPPAAAAAPPPPPAQTAAPPPANDSALQAAPPGWTLDHIKEAASKFTSNPAKGGASALAEVLRPYCPAGEARPSIKKIYPAHWPTVHATLVA